VIVSMQPEVKSDPAHRAMGACSLSWAYDHHMGTPWFNAFTNKTSSLKDLRKKSAAMWADHRI
jgi:hypothetical protein